MNLPHFCLRKLVWASVTSMTGSPCHTHGCKLVLGANAMRNFFPLSIAVVSTLWLPAILHQIDPCRIEFTMITPRSYGFGDVVAWGHNLCVSLQSQNCEFVGSENCLAAKKNHHQQWWYVKLPLDSSVFVQQRPPNKDAHSSPDTPPNTGWTINCRV